LDAESWQKFYNYNKISSRSNRTMKKRAHQDKIN
jgi:hypothetical protein